MYKVECNNSVHTELVVNADTGGDAKRYRGNNYVCVFIENRTTGVTESGTTDAIRKNLLN